MKKVESARFLEVDGKIWVRFNTGGQTFVDAEMSLPALSAHIADGMIILRSLIQRGHEQTAKPV